MNPTAHYMIPGTVAFIPGWILLFITILTLAILQPTLFIYTGSSSYGNIISPFLLIFTIGSLMPAFDDLFAYIFGKPFAHHSLFHSFAGTVTTFIIFYFLGGFEIGKYALLGNFYHIFFNFFLDYTTLLFPLTYREFGLTHIIKITTYQIKVVFYPLILLIFGWAILTSVWEIR